MARVTRRVIDVKGKARAHYLLARLMERARDKGASVPAMVTTDYINTIPPEQEPWFPGNEDIERRIRAFVRWNAVAMVDRANHRFDGLGGHLSTYASAASLYEVGFNHFFRGKGDGGFGDQVFIQGHAAPGIYARAFLEGRLDRGAARPLPAGDDGAGPAVVPAPAPAPGLLGVPDRVDGPRTAERGVPGAVQPLPLQPQDRRHVERHGCGASSATASSTSPKSTAALDLAARERLDNLIFVVNCNLQRLDGPVRGNGKVIQEFESTFRGMGWNVIKVVWGRQWDELLARDVDGVLVNKMNTTVDGEFQKYAVESGGYIREHFFGPDPRLRKMVGAPLRRGAAAAPARWPRLPQGLRGVQDRGGARGHADGHPRQDDQGLDARHRLRGAQRDAPDQEDVARPAEGAARPSVHGDPRRGARGGDGAVLPSRRRVARVRVHDGAAARARRLPARSRRAVEDRARAARGHHRPARRRHRRQGAGVDDDRVHAVARACC